MHSVSGLRRNRSRLMYPRLPSTARWIAGWGIVLALMVLSLQDGVNPLVQVLALGLLWCLLAIAAATLDQRWYL